MDISKLTGGLLGSSAKETLAKAAQSAYERYAQTQIEAGREPLPIDEWQKRQPSGPTPGVRG